MGKLNIQPGNVFLDIGCGSGAVSLEASRYTDKIFGIDIASGGGGDLQGKSSLQVIFSRERHPRSCQSFPRSTDASLAARARSMNSCLFSLKRQQPGCIIVANLARIGIASHVARR